MTIYRTRKSPVMVALSKKRAELSQQALDLKRRHEEKLAEILTLDKTMAILGIACDWDLARPRRKCVRIFGHGELKRLLITILKESGIPMTTRQVADELARKKKLLQDQRCRVKRAMTKYKVIVQVGKTESGESLWTLKAYATSAKDDESKPRLRLVRSQ